MKSKTDEEKADRLVAYLNAELFEHYFDHFMEENATTEAAKSSQVVKKALLEKFSTKKTKSETRKEEVNQSYQGEDVKEFFVKASKVYKEADFNEGTKEGTVIEAIRSDHNLLHFVLLRKVRTSEDVKETCLEYAEHQKLYPLIKKVTGNSSSVLDFRTYNKQQGTDEPDLNKIDMLCKKFEYLALEQAETENSRCDMPQVQEDRALSKPVPNSN